MQCQQLIGPADKPRQCSVPATYTVYGHDDEGVFAFRHVCAAHARKIAGSMDRLGWSVSRDRDGMGL